MCQLAGLRVGHEQYDRDGACGWPQVIAENRAGHISDVTLHQVRHPVDAIASMSTHVPALWAIIGQHVPMPEPPGALAGRMLYWLAWNLSAELQASWTYRVEELRRGTPTARKFRRLVGIASGLPDVSRNTNTRAHQTLTWDDLHAASPTHADAIRVTARRYGYDT